MNPLHDLARAIAARLPKRAYPILRGPLRGQWFILGAAAGAGGGGSVFLGLVEARQSARVARDLRPGNVFFDVGANVGFYTLLAAARVGPSGRVVAFEPWPGNIAYLEKHLAVNRVRNAIVVQSACADRPGWEPFHPGANCALGRLAEAPEAAQRPDAVRVPVQTLDAYSGQSGIVPDVVKIDVEGAELRVLHGARHLLERARPRIFLSTHSAELRSGCLAFLDRLGYVCRPLDAASEEEAYEFVAAPARLKSSKLS